MPFPYRLNRTQQSMFSPIPRPSNTRSRYQDEIDQIDFGASDALDNAAQQEYNNASDVVRKPRPMLNMDDLNPRPTPLGDKYRSMLETGPPVRTRPGWGTIAGAALAGFGPQGPKATMDILEQPYTRKREQYLINKDALSDATLLERQREQDRIGGVKDKFAIEDRRFDNERQEALASQAAIDSGWRNKNYQSLIEDRANKAKAEGWRPFVDKTTGMTIYGRVNPKTGAPEQMPLAKFDESLNEGSNRRVSDARRIGADTLSRSKDLSNYNNLTGSQWKLYNDNNAEVRLGQRADAAEVRRNARPVKPPSASQQQAANNFAITKLLDADVINDSDFVGKDTKKGSLNSNRSREYVAAVAAGKTLAVKPGSKTPEHPRGIITIVDPENIDDAISDGYEIIVEGIR